MTEKEIQKCRVCGCTNEDCSQCIEKTGSPCFWIEKDLCSACSDVLPSEFFRVFPAYNSGSREDKLTCLNNLQSWLFGERAKLEKEEIIEDGPYFLDMWTEVIRYKDAVRERLQSEHAGLLMLLDDITKIINFPE